MEDVWEIVYCPNELQQKKTQLKTLDTYCIYEKKNSMHLIIYMSYLSTNHALFPPTLPPFGVANSINERFLKMYFFFLVNSWLLKSKITEISQFPAGIQAITRHTQKNYSRNKNILNPRTPSHSKTMTNHGEKPCKQCYRHIDD